MAQPKDGGRDGHNSTFSHKPLPPLPKGRPRGALLGAQNSALPVTPRVRALFPYILPRSTKNLDALHASAIFVFTPSYARGALLGASCHASRRLLIEHIFPRSSQVCTHCVRVRLGRSLKSYVCGELLGRFLSRLPTAAVRAHIPPFVPSLHALCACATGALTPSYALGSLVGAQNSAHKIKTLHPKFWDEAF